MLEVHLLVFMVAHCSKTDILWGCALSKRPLGIRETCPAFSVQSQSDTKHNGQTRPCSWVPLFTQWMRSCPVLLLLLILDTRGHCCDSVGQKRRCKEKKYSPRYITDKTI